MNTENRYKISVVIPAYNSENTIKIAIESIYQQNFNDVQIIVVNDGSTDGTKKILEHYLDDDNFMLINQNNKGVSAARNAGIQRATGKYIFFLDSDDYIGCNVFNSLYKFAENKQLQLVACEYRQICGRLIENELTPNIEFYTETKEQVEEHFFDVLPKFTTAKLFLRESIINNSNYFPINMDLGEDLYFVCNFLRFITRIGKIDNVYYYNVNINSNSLSKKYINRMEKNVDLQYHLWSLVCEEYKGLRNKYNSNHMSYGYYLTALYIANFFKFDCKERFANKYKHIKKFIKNHKNNYLVEKGNPKTFTDKIIAITLQSKITILMIILFSFKEKIKIIRNKIVNDK